MSTPFKLRSGNTTPFKQMGSSPAKSQGFFVTDEFGESTQVSKTDYYKADKDKRYSTGKARTVELTEGYEAKKKAAIDRGASKDELADLKEAFISGSFEEYQRELEYWQTPEGQAEYKKQKELGI
jgi:hypothetical protein